MKIYTISFLLIIGFILNTKAQQGNEELINLLIQKNIIKQSDADSLRAELAIKAQTDKEKQNKFPLLTSKQFTLNGYTQIRFLSQQEKGKPDAFDIRRAYLDLKGLVNEHWDYRLQVDFASSPRILDAVITYKHRDCLKLSAGQLKIPFTQESTTSDNLLETIDRSQAVESFVARGKDVIGNQNGRDLGIQASGNVVKIKDRFLLDYYVGVFDGAGINVADNNEAKDLSGRIVLHPIKNLDLGASYYSGFGRFATPGISSRDQTRERLGFELKYTYKIASIKSEYIQGQDGLQKIRGEYYSLNRSGWYTQLSAYVYKKNIQFVAEYDTYDPNTKPDITGDLTNNFIAGVNFYFNNWSKLQINFTSREEEKKQYNNDLIAAQLQISF